VAVSTTSSALIPTATVAPTEAFSPTPTRTATPTAVHADEAERVFNKVLAAQSALESLECEVVRLQIAPGATPVEATGTLMVRDGGLARLEITRPSPQRAVSDGRFLWVEMAEVKQVMQYDAAALRQSGNFFLDLGSSLKHFGQGSSKKLVPPGPGFDAHRVAALELKPAKPADAGFEKMRLWIELGRWTVLQVSLNQDGAENRIRFLNSSVVTKAEAEKKSKKPLAMSHFEYKAPKGYEVFDMRNMP
jgi:outer membrane lipoprotein-sorting protein